MKVRPLVIDDAARAKIQKLVAWAKDNPYSFERMKRIMEGLEPPPGDEASIILDFGYRVVYSIENHPLKQPTAQSKYMTAHHLSVSVSCDRNTWPSTFAVDSILREFGMPPKENCFIYLENEDNDKLPSAVNLVAEYKKE